MKKLALLFLLGICIYSCDEGGVGPEVCTKRWSVTKSTAASASVSGGSLHLSSTVINANEEAAVILSTDTLIGDFNMTVSFDQFAEGVNLGGYFYLKVYTQGGDPNKAFMLSMQNVTTAANGLQIGVAADSTGSTVGTTGNFTSTSTNAGFFRIRRTGAQVTLDVISGSSTLNLVKDYDNLPMRYSLILGSNFQQITNSSVRINDVAITGALNAAGSDNFSCNSLQ